MRRKGIQPRITCVNAVLHGFALLKDSDSAVRLLEGMEGAFGVVPDTVRHLPLISASAVFPSPPPAPATPPDGS